MNRDEFEHISTVDEFEIVSVDEAGIDVTVPAIEPSDDEVYEEAIEENEDDEEPEQARANRWVIRRARRAARKHGAGFTRSFRKGRMPENMVEKTVVEEEDASD